jgi:hypothetical protein
MSADGSEVLGVLGRRLYRFRVAAGRMIDAFDVLPPDLAVAGTTRLLVAGTHTAIVTYEERPGGPPFLRYHLYAVPLD